MHDLDHHGVLRFQHQTSPQSVNKRKNVSVNVPVIKQGEQKAVAVLAVYPDGKGIAISAKNRYKVDWGDGTTQNFGSGAIATHVYNFEALDESTLNPKGYKEVIIIIEPQKRYQLTELNFDPVLEEFQNLFEADQADWLSIDVSMPKGNGFVLSQGKVKNRHPQLEYFSVRN